MNIQLVTTGSRKWLYEDSCPAWGLGIQVQEVSEPVDWDIPFHAIGSSPEVDRFGFMIEVMVGPWMLVVWTGRAYEGFHGPAHHPMPFFEFVGTP